MKRHLSPLFALLLAALLSPAAGAADEEGWITLFDGTSLDGWKIAENPDSFQLRDGAMVAKGPRAHAFYVGDVQNAEFTDFELKVDLLTRPRANGGIYFRTKWQESGWPAYGREAQVNNTHGDPKKTASLYNLVDVLEAPAKDDEWFTQHIIVRGNRVTIKVNDKQLVDTEIPASVLAQTSGLGLWPASGTIGLQCHDPGSEVHYKNIRIKPLK